MLLIKLPGVREWSLINAWTVEYSMSGILRTISLNRCPKVPYLKLPHQKTNHNHNIRLTAYSHIQCHTPRLHHLYPPCLRLPRLLHFAAAKSLEDPRRHIKEPSIIKSGPRELKGKTYQYRYSSSSIMSSSSPASDPFPESLSP